MTYQATIGPFVKTSEREIGNKLTTILGSIFSQEPQLEVSVEQVPEPDDDPGGKVW